MMLYARGRCVYRLNFCSEGYIVKIRAVNAFVVAALTLAVLSGCQTPYQEFGSAVQGGVSSEQIGYDRFRISAEVTAYTPVSRVSDYLQLKAAETTVQNGASHFVVESLSDASKTNIYATPGVVNCWGSGCIATPSTVQQLTNPGAVMIIRIVRTGTAQGAISAREIIDTIGKRIKRKS